MILSGCHRYFGKSDVGKSAEHEIHHRPITFLGGAKGHAVHSGFRQRRVDDPVLSEFLDQAHGVGKDAAADILADQDAWLDRFIKVIPYEYKKVMQELQLEEIKQKLAAVEKDVEMIGDV